MCCAKVEPQFVLRLIFGGLQFILCLFLFDCCALLGKLKWEDELDLVDFDFLCYAELGLSICFRVGLI